MNRRNFFGKLLIAGASFAILPPASTYGRIWKAERQVINPAWVSAPFEMTCFYRRGSFIVFDENIDVKGYLGPTVSTEGLRYVFDPKQNLIVQVSKHL